MNKYLEKISEASKTLNEPFLAQGGLKKSAEKGIVIVDFDDTLSDAGHRKHHVEVKSGKPDFDEFNRRAHFDKPNMDVILKIRQLHKEGNDIVIMSGRSDMVKQQAIQWLQQNNVPYQRLIMRPASSRMKSTELKKIWLKDIDTKKVIAAIDDKPENLNMFRAHGIPSYRVRDGKIEGQIVSNKYLDKVMEKVAATSESQRRQFDEDTTGSYGARYRNFVKNPEAEIKNLTKEDRGKILKSQKYWLSHSTRPESIELVKSRGEVLGAATGGIAGSLASTLAKSKKGKAALVATGILGGTVGGRKLLDRQREKTLPGFEKRIKMLESKSK